MRKLTRLQRAGLEYIASASYRHNKPQRQVINRLTDLGLIHFADAISKDPRKRYRVTRKGLDLMYSLGYAEGEVYGTNVVILKRFRKAG